MKQLTEEHFREMARATGRTDWRVTMIRLLDRLITIVVFLSYPLLLGFLYFYRRDLLLQSIIVPALCFFGVTLFRKLYDAPRPYEAMDFTPVIHKDTKGKSFPSRHVFSIFMIGMTYMQVDRSLGAIVLLLGTIMAAIRVLGGVHFIRDVIAGALTGIMCGFVGYYLITWGQVL